MGVLYHLSELLSSSIFLNKNTFTFCLALWLSHSIQILWHIAETPKHCVHVRCRVWLPGEPGLCVEPDVYVGMKCTSFSGGELIRFSGKRLSLRSFPSYCYAFEFLPVRWVKGFIFVFECIEFKCCLCLEHTEVEFHFIPTVALCHVSEKKYFFFIIFVQHSS